MQDVTGVGADEPDETPRRRRRWVWISVVGVVVVIVIAALANGGDDEPEPTADPVTSAGPLDRDEPSDPAPETTTPGASPSTTEPAVSTTSTATTTTPRVVGGTRDAPFAYGTAAEVQFDSFGDADDSIWNTTIGAPVDITDAVLAENQFNDPPPEGILFAGFTVEMTLIEAGKEPLAPSFNISWEILGGSTSVVHDEFGSGLGCGVTPDEFDGFSEVFVGGTLSGIVCVAIPAEDLTDPGTQIAIHHSADTRTIFGP